MAMHVWGPLRWHPILLVANGTMSCLLVHGATLHEGDTGQSQPQASHDL